MANLQKKFGRIYDQYINKIYRFIFLKVNSQEIAEDLCSETFLRCWNAFKEKNPGIKNIRALLYQIAKNLVIDYYREKSRHKIIPIENIQLVDPKINLQGQAMLSSSVNQVKQAIVNLKEDYQNVIIWHYLDDLPISQIAELLGRTEGTTRVLLHRALKTLRDKLNYA